MTRLLQKSNIFMHYHSVGNRSDDPLSPAFVPSLFIYAEPRN